MKVIMELYEIWDAALNTLWTELKDELSEDEFAKLLEEQRDKDGTEC